MNVMLSRARSDAQALHHRIYVTTIKDHAAIRLHLRDVEEQARVLADAVKTAIDGDRAHPHRHLLDVAILLEAAAGQLGNLAYSSKSELCEVTQSLRAKATIAVRGLSGALAAERCKNKRA
jgi:hypothetical protein